MVNGIDVALLEETLLFRWKRRLMEVARASSSLSLFVKFFALAIGMACIRPPSIDAAGEKGKWSKMESIVD